MFCCFFYTGRSLKQVKIIGITGGIGAGKSLLSKIYSEQGYPVFNADQIAKEILAKGSPGWKEVVAAFGQEILLDDGEIDRKKLRAEISKDPEARQRLDSITHPKIQARSKEHFEEAAKEGHALIFYEAPLLFEAKSDKKMDFVICVVAPDELRVQRTALRDKRPPEEVRKLLQSQMSQEEKAKRSAFVIENKGNEADFKKEALALLARIQNSQK